jgi:hypothetical protein
MKIICCGDLHGNPLWKQIVNKYINEDVLYIFIGDYFDSYIYNCEQQCNNFLDIIAFKEANPTKVILLIGNHDASYLNEDENCSGYQQIGKYQIKPLLDKYKHLLQIAYKQDNYLFSHAGICPTFLDWTFGKDGWNIDNFVDKLNEMFVYKPLFLTFNGINSYGDDVGQTPVWIRPRALMQSNKNGILHKKFVQIVGHTTQNQIDIEGKSTGKKYFFIDTLNSNQEYFVIKNKAFQAHKIQK